MDLFSIMPIVFVSVMGIAALIFIFVFVLMFSSKARAKMLGKQVKTMNYVIDENEDALRNISTKGAEISSKGIETTARAIKKGLTEEEDNNLVFCRHCGKEIEEDSKFCKHCGKEQ